MRPILEGDAIQKSIVFSNMKILNRLFGQPNPQDVFSMPDKVESKGGDYSAILPQMCGKPSRFTKITGLLLRVDHTSRHVENANHSHHVSGCKTWRDPACSHYLRK